MAKKINVLHLGYALGITGALYALFLGIVAWLYSWGADLVFALSSYYIGYAPTLGGALIGTLWVLVDGFIAGVLIAVFYNLFQQK